MSSPYTHVVNAIYVVLVHGAGDSARVWDDVRHEIRFPTLAIDLPGRGSHPGDLTNYTFDQAASQACQDIDITARNRPVALVAHSIGGSLSPVLAAHLGRRLTHLVHIAAVAAPPGELPLATASPTFAENLIRNAHEIRSQVSGKTYVADGDPTPEGLAPTSDRLALTRLDSLTLGCVPTKGLTTGAYRRTFIRPTRDRLYPPDAQDRLAAAMNADQTIGIEAGHNTALNAGALLAASLNDILIDS